MALNFGKLLNSPFETSNTVGEGLGGSINERILTDAEAEYERVSFLVNALPDHFRQDVPKILVWATGPPPENQNKLNDGLFDVYTALHTIGDYYEFKYDYVVRIQGFRVYGDNTMNGDGSWKLRYLDIFTQTWVDWITNIPTRNTLDWSPKGMSDIVITNKIRLEITAVDTAGVGNRLRELEVIY